MKLDPALGFGAVVAASNFPSCWGVLNLVTSTADHRHQLGGTVARFSPKPQSLDVWFTYNWRLFLSWTPSWTARSPKRVVLSFGVWSPRRSLRCTEAVLTREPTPRVLHYPLRPNLAFLPTASSNRTPCWSSLANTSAWSVLNRLLCVT